MALMKWDPGYSVRNELMDDQHKQLFDMINRLHEAMKKGKGREITGELIDRMMEYATFHFRSEEELMYRSNFPTLLEHKHEHAAFIDRIGEFRKAHEEGEFMVPIEIGDFLSEWLSEHILISDRMYITYLKDTSIR